MPSVRSSSWDEHFKPTSKEPLALWFPELNSAQIARLRKMLAESHTHEFKCICGEEVEKVELAY